MEREDVRPAPYLGRYRWVMLDRPVALVDGELRDLIGRSYRMVLNKAGWPQAGTNPEERIASEARKGRKQQARHAGPRK